MNKAPSLALAPACHFEGNVPAPAKFPLECAFLLLPYCGLADAIHCDQGLGEMSMLQNCCAVMASRCGIRMVALHVIVHETVP